MKKIYFLLFMSFIFGSNLFAQTPVITDTAAYDVFMNLDPARGLDPTSFANDVSGYFSDWGAASGSYRINTSAVTLDPTDVRKREVFVHAQIPLVENPEQLLVDKAYFKNADGGGVVTASEKVSTELEADVRTFTSEYDNEGFRT